MALLSPTHGDHAHHSKKLKLALVEVVELERQHLPEENFCEHSENYIDGNCSPFSIVTILLFMVYNFQLYFSHKPIMPGPAAFTFFPQISQIQTSFLFAV